MKNILKYITMAAVALMTTACQEGLDQLSDSDQGCVTLNIKMMEQTRSFTPEELRVRIYDTKNTDSTTDDALVRIYTEEDEIPSEIYLVEGKYRITVEGRDKAHTEVFKEDADTPKAKLYYKGETSLEVKPGTTSEATVECSPQNVRVGVVLDRTLDDSENAKLQDVQISLAAATLVANGNGEYKKEQFTAAIAGGVKKLDFGGTGDNSFSGTSYGFFLLADGATSGNIAWVATGNHVDDKETADNTADDVTTPFDKAGQFEVKPGKAYQINFVFQKAPNGAVTVDIRVEQMVDTFNNEFGFKPQPEFSSKEWLKADKDNASKNVYTGKDVVFNVEALNPMDKLKVNDIEIQLNADESKKSGVTVTPVSGKETGTSYTITLGSDFFKTMAGGSQDIKFEAFEAGALAGDYELRFTNMGLDINNTTADLWANTAKFNVLITDGSSVKVKFRKKGTSEWAETKVGTSTDGVAIVKSEAVWSDGFDNGHGHTVYTPDSNKSIFANNTYECQLVVNDAGYGPIVEYETGGGQTIPGGDFEDPLSCFVDGTQSSMWGSGNNDMASLCKQGTYKGMQGEHCAFLDGSAAMFNAALASGNIFVGQFSFALPTGTVSFGHNYKWTARPTAIKLKEFHSMGTVDFAMHKHENQIAKGASDYGSIYVCIVRWKSQHNVSSGTSASPIGVWSPEDGAEAVSEGEIIGYGVVYPTGTTTVDGKVTDSMVDMTIPIQYYDTVTNPSEETDANFTLVISAATSRYGDYMNGSSGSDMYVDDFQWVY